MKYLLIAFLLLWFSLINFSLNAQDYHKIDSCKTLLNKAGDDTTQIRLCIQIGNCFENFNDENAIA